MSKAEERSKEIMQAALDYANNLDDIKPTDEFSKNLCIALGQAFIKGAEWADNHQAEKDLDVVSWVKEVSGVKDMSRAKEEALKAYPPQSIAANYDTINRRDAFEYGYLKAEKDNELTWEDIPKIFSISEQLKTSWWFRDNEQTKQIGTQVFWEEVLKRFKAQKEES